MLPNNFNPQIYKFLNEDLNFMNDAQLISHYENFGIKENRLYFIELPDDFDSNIYKNLNCDLSNLNDVELKIHYYLHGKYEKREYKLNNIIDNQSFNQNSNENVKKIDYENQFINNHKNISYKTYNYNNTIEHKKYILDGIKIFVNLKNNYWKDFDVEYFEYENKVLDKNFFNKVLKNSDCDLFLIINNENLSSNYLGYHCDKLSNMIDNDYNIINCSMINTRETFYKNIEKRNRQIYEENRYGEFLYDSYLINKKTINKIIDNNDDDLLFGIKTGIITRPYLKYENYDNQQLNYEISKTLWDTYFRVNSFWNKIYCVNLGFDIGKRRNMAKYCYLLNNKEENFFHQGIFGLNLPEIDTIINMGLIDCNIIGKYRLPKGAIGLNITQKNIFEDAIKKNYDYIFLLEDDISFDINFFEVFDIFFSRYNDFDICYVGSSFYEERNEVLNLIDTIQKTNIYTPKMDLLRKISIAGCFAVILSKKLMKIFLNRFTPIDNISDVLLADIAFDIKYDFSDKERTKTKYNLKTYFMLDNLFKVDIDKPSLTDENVFSLLDNLVNNPSIKYLSKIKKINFKIKHKIPIKIYCGDFALLYNKFIFELLLEIIPNSIQVYYYNESVDISFFADEDKYSLIENVVNIIINGEKELSHINCDIGIVTTLDDIYKYNIYFPFIWTSLWERRDNYKTIKNNTREKFCAYMYKKKVEYRTELFKFISNYKQVDALGECCNNDFNKKIDRYVYNENETYNDLAVKKYSNYKFVLALENGIYPGYSTEKLINPIIAGSIPVYAGSNEIFKYINKNRVIYINDFENYDKLLEYIIKVDNDDELYDSIVNQEIFCGDINFENFEENLKNQLKKAFGLEKRKIQITNEKNFINTNIDMKILDLFIPSDIKNYNDTKIYISDFINEQDDLIW